MDKMSTFDSLDPIPTLGEGKVVGTSKRIATPVEVKHRWEAPLPKGVTVGPNGKWVFDPAKGEKPPEPKSVVGAKAGMTAVEACEDAAWHPGTEAPQVEGIYEIWDSYGSELTWYSLFKEGHWGVCRQEYESAPESWYARKGGNVRNVDKWRVPAQAQKKSDLEGFHIGDWVMVDKERFPQDLVGMDELMRVTGFSQKDWLEVSVPSGAKGFELMPCFAKKVEVRFARQGSAKGHGHFVVLESRGYGPLTSNACLCEDGAFFSSLMGQLDNFSVVVPA